MSYSVPINLVVVLSFVIFVFYILGIHNVLTNLDQNECEMTYMFEFPQFVEISLPPSVQLAYPRYALYGYAEGGHTQMLRHMKFKGIPVLFIPGSSGSYKQGRSLASVSLRKAINSRTPFYFDYFMVDFNEDLSGIYGGVLDDQTKFVRHCITKIFSFYSRDKQNPDMSIILIGHSLGGIIAKAVFLEPGFKPESVKLIINLAAPLKRPVIQPDVYITNFYKKVEMHWKNNPKFNHTTLISISGGARDLLVRSDLTHDSLSQVNVMSTSIPGVWCSNDHLSIVWCKQLVLVVVRAIFDCIDKNTKQVTTNQELRASIMKYHFLQRSAGKRYLASQHQALVPLDRNAHWYENMLSQFSVLEHKSAKSNSYIMIRLQQEPDLEFAFIETYNLNIKDWIFTCSADVMYKSVRICQQGENLSNATEIAPVPPKSKTKKKFIYLNLMELKRKDFTHVVVNVPRMDSSVQVNVDIHSQKERVINYDVPSIYRWSRDTIIPNTKDNSIFYKINLVGLESVWQAFSLGIETISCKTDKNGAVISFMIPWASQHTHTFMKDRKSMTVKIALPSTRMDHTTEQIYPFLRLNLDPTCSYKITIKPSVVYCASQVALFFTSVLPAYIVTVLLLTLRQQIMHLENGESMFFHSTLCAAVRRYYLILQATILGTKIFGLGFFHYILPVPDFFTIDHLNMDFFFMSIILYGIAIIATYSSGIACYVSVVMSGKAAHKMALRFVAKSITGLINSSEWVLSVLHQVPILVSVLLVALAFSTSGALSLCLGCMFYFLKISNMYEDYLEDLFHYSLKLIADRVKGLRNKKAKAEKSEEKSQEGLSEEKSEESSEDKVEGNLEETSSKAEEVKNELDDKSGGKSDGEEKSEERAVVKRKESESSDESDKSVVLSENEINEIGLLSAIHFHVTVFLLWCMATLLHVPSLLVWARNYHHSVFLEKDPALLPSLILNICGGILWQSGVPYSCRKLTRITSTIIFMLAAISIIYASVSLYRLSYVISAAVILLTFTQMTGRFSS